MRLSSLSHRNPIHKSVGVRLSTARLRATAVVASAMGLLFAPAALADTTTSSNWAGYAVHRTGVSYRAVEGSWRQPSVSCTPGARTYSSYWVGLGGYSVNSRALEQIGTEVDCTGSGKVRSTAWYELVPDPSVQLELTVVPGDVLKASVSISGRRVSLSLYDVTRGHGFVRTVTASLIDVTSAEWIVEAPSECISANACETLPLANFGSAQFTSALATSSARHAGGILDPAWQTTKINLVPSARRFFVSTGSFAPSIGVAMPSALGADGRSFAVSYSRVSSTTTSQSVAKRSSALRAGYLVHPGR